MLSRATIRVNLMLGGRSMRSAQRIRLLATLLVIISARLFASSAAVRVNESEMSAAISEKQISPTVLCSIFGQTPEVPS
jgi:hypothetical protein